MTTEAFLVINRNLSLRVVKNRPQLSNDEVALRLQVTLPANFFERMIPTVDLEVPAGAIYEPVAEVAVKLTAKEVSEKLHLDYDAVLDGLAQAIENSKTIDESDFTSKDISIELHKNGFYVPSLF